MSRRLVRALAAIGGAALVLVVTGGSGIATGGTVLLGSPSNFESGDGNMTVEGSPATDWNCFVGGGFTTANKGTGACQTTTGATTSKADPNGEVEWVGGQKFDTQCPALNTGNNPPKDEFTNIAQFLEFATVAPFAGDLFFYGAAERSTNNGNASGDVEFNQGSGNGTTSAGCRTANDRLVAYDFLSGGSALSFHILTWIDSAHPTAGGNNGTCFVKTDSPPCWGAFVIVPSAGAFNGEANQSPIAAADNAISGDLQPVNQFAEFGVDLTAALVGTGNKLPCFPQQVWESRSSGSSFTSNPQDIEFQHSSTCGNITIIKHTDPRGLDQMFNYSTTGGLSPATFSLNDVGNTTGDSIGNTQSYMNVSVGTYSVTEITPVFGFVPESLSCTNTGTGSGSVTYSGGTPPVTATINLQGNDNWVCIYVNKQQLGAIKITKTSSKAAATALAGAHFELCTNLGPYTVSNPCAPAKTGSDDLITGSGGTVCVDNLAFATYYVTEKSAPAGYAIDDSATHSVSVSHNAKCSDSTFGGESLRFTDTPLTDISASATSEVAGGTQSTISCTDSNGNVVASAPLGGSVTASALALPPGIYTCVITVDP